MRSAVSGTPLNGCALCSSKTSTAPASSTVSPEVTTFALDDAGVAAANLEALRLLIRPDAAVTHVLNRSKDRAVPEATIGNPIADVLPLNALSRCPAIVRGSIYVTSDAAEPLSVQCPIYPIDHGTLACVMPATPTIARASSGCNLRAASGAAIAGTYSDGSAVSRTRCVRARPRSRWASALVGSAASSACRRTISATVGDVGRPVAAGPLDGSTGVGEELADADGEDEAGAIAEFLEGTAPPHPATTRRTKDRDDELKRAAVVVAFSSPCIRSEVRPG